MLRNLPIMPFVVALTLALVAHVVAQEADSPTKPLEPAEALHSFKLHADFRIELVASEPLVEDPVAMAFDERGDLYVVEYPEFNEYQFPRDVARSGRVKHLQDTNDDGEFDKATVFVKVPFATAVICYGGGVFVGAPPEILYCKDTDGDGVADERRVVLTGFGRDFAGGGLMNSFRWGFDNRIHIATGFAGGQVRRPDQDPSLAVDVRRRGLILDPRTHDFAATSGGGQHGMSMDEWGNKFLCSNVYPLQMLMYDDRYVARNPFFNPPAPSEDINGEDPLATLKRLSPLEPWRISRSRLAEKEQEASRPGGVFTSASGITVYRGDAFPQEFYGNLFVGEVANNLAYRARLERRGIVQAAFRADDKNAEFLASPDSWFRPVQFSNGPDGGLYVVDMYRQLIEGAAFVPKDELAKLNPSLGTDRGRIYRIVPRSFKRRARPRLDQLTTPELVAMLEHPNGWHQQTAARLLYERSDARSLNPLDKLARDSKRPLSRMLALYSLDDQRALHPELLLSALRDPGPLVRMHAVRLSERHVNASASLREELLGLVDDPDVRVRYQLAFTLGELTGGRRNAALADILKQDLDDPWMRLAVQSSLSSGAGDVFARLARADRVTQSQRSRLFLTQLVAQIGRQSEANEVAAVLKVLASMADDEKQFSEHLQAVLFASIRRDRFPKLNESSATGELLAELIEKGTLLAADRAAPRQQRVQAVRTLGLADFKSPEIQKLFEGLLAADEPAPIQLAAVETMAKLDHPRVAELLLEAWSRMTPSLRRTTVETLLSRLEWTRLLLASVENGRIAASDLDSSRMNLVASGATAPMKARIEGLFAATPDAERAAAARTYQNSLKLVGNKTRGAAVFKRACAACHKRADVGKDVGPPLNDAARRAAEALLVDILDPNRALKPLYQNYVVRIEDGRVVTGMIVEESANGIRLQQADGTIHEVLRIQIESLKSTGVSFMPEGLEKMIDQQAMADLLAFLRTS